MKKALRILGIVAVTIFAIIVILASWVNLSPLPKYDHMELDLAIISDSSHIAQGRKVVETVCWYCHQGQDGKLSGKIFTDADSEFGEIWSANLTSHQQSGIGRYTANQLGYTIRTGITKEGRYLGPYMNFPTMSDEDLANVIAYLQSPSHLTEPSSVKHPKPEYSFLATALFKLAFQPITTSTATIHKPANNDKIAMGKYLATSLYQCGDCHSASFETYDLLDPENSPGFFGGGNPIENSKRAIVHSANLTPHMTDGIGSWTRDQFAQAVRSGRAPANKILSDAMPRFTLLSDEEIDLIWSYLQQVPALKSTPSKKPTDVVAGKSH